MKTCSSVQAHCKDTDALVARKYLNNTIDVGAVKQTMDHQKTTVDFPVVSAHTKLALHAKGLISMREI